MTLLESFFRAVGSHSDDIPSETVVDNPLPPCPNSPNCIRITQTIDAPIDLVFAASREAIESMKPEKTKISKDNYSINTVFRVFFFRDDLAVQLSPNNVSSTYLHIRSASREGFSDLGVNSRRVKRFLKQLKLQL